MNSIYLDNSATTKPCKEAVSAMEKAMTSVYGNPSSVHGAGCVAAQLLLDSRNEIMCALFGENMRNLLPATPVSRSKAGAYGNVFFTERRRTPAAPETQRELPAFDTVSPPPLSAPLKEKCSGTDCIHYL